MALVTLFIRGGHAGDASVALDCTCGCEDICAPTPITPDEDALTDTTPADILTNEPVPTEDCGVDVTIASETDALTPFERSIREATV